MVHPLIQHQKGVQILYCFYSPFLGIYQLSIRTAPRGSEQAEAMRCATSRVVALRERKPPKSNAIVPPGISDVWKGETPISSNSYWPHLAISHHGLKSKQSCPTATISHTIRRTICSLLTKWFGNRDWGARCRQQIPPTALMPELHHSYGTDVKSSFRKIRLG